MRPGPSPRPTGKLSRSSRAVRTAPGHAAQFLVGGQFREFLIRYPESWLMYAKMMNTHVLVSQVRGDKYKKKAAQNELWKGQSHHAYWHSGPGGIYENALRKAVYQSLIEAEKITRATEIFAPSIISVDYDMDNSQRVPLPGLRAERLHPRPGRRDVRAGFPPGLVELPGHHGRA